MQFHLDLVSRRQRGLQPITAGVMSESVLKALCKTSGWALPKVLAALTELEMDGRAVCESGRWFARVS